MRKSKPAPRNSKFPKNDQNYMDKMVKVLELTFGTQDLDWFSAAETIINALFTFKSAFCHDTAVKFLN